MKNTNSSYTAATPVDTHDLRDVAEYPLVESVLSNLTPDVIRALAKKQVQKELKDAARARRGARGRDQAQYVACKAQSHMAEGTAQEWALGFLQATGIDARNCRRVYSGRFETLGDFVTIDEDKAINRY